MRDHCILLFLLLAMLTVTACKHKDETPAPASVTENNFPADVANIFINRCATSGCHNAESYTNAGDLLLDSWQHLFEHGNNGAVVVPYSPAYSSLLYFINTHADLGPVAEPTMPLNGTPLSREEYLVIRNWIANGAPDKNGNIPFASNADTRQKVYITQQGCDLVAVVDADKKVVMRYIPVGKTYPAETPDDIVVSDDGRYAYVCFWNGTYIQKIDTRTDSIAGEINMGNAYWKTLCLSHDGTKLAAVSRETQSLHILSTENMQVLYTLGNGTLESPESIMANAGFDTFYVTSQFGNTIYKLTRNSSRTIAVDGNAPTTISGTATPDPYRILPSPDGKYYFVVCENTDELRIMESGTDKLLSVIPTGRKPQEITVCKNKPWLIVSCTGDTVGTSSVGSVLVINYNARQIVKSIQERFSQPYGVAVDEQHGLLFIASRNQASQGPRPHHPSPCNGRNGFYQVYNLNTLEPANNIRYEVSVDPYAAAARFR